MAEINPCNWLQNAGETHTAAQMRTGVGGLIFGSRSSGSVTSRGGVNPSIGGGLEVSQTGSGAMSVNIASGVVFVPGTEAAAAGTYICTNDAIVTKSVNAADGSNDRIDLVIARVLDSFYFGASNLWQLSVVAGNPASVPVIPTAPSNSIVIARILVEAGTDEILNEHITDVRPFLTASGGIVPVRDTDERDALVSQYDGLAIWRQDTHDLEIWDSSDWFSIADQLRAELSAMFPPSVQAVETTTFENFNTDGFEPTNPACEITFTAPTSGRAKIDILIGIDADNDDERMQGDIMVRETNENGAIFRAPGGSDLPFRKYYLEPAPFIENFAGWRFLEGLTPGQVYWAQNRIRTFGLDMDVASQVMMYTPLS